MDYPPLDRTWDQQDDQFNSLLQSSMDTLSEIPRPPTIPLLGNAALVDLDVPLRTFLLLAKQYGEIYRMSFSGGIVLIHVNTAAMVQQLSDDARFKKSVSRGLREVRNLAGDGLFTADIEEPNWGIARKNFNSIFSQLASHCKQWCYADRILLPAFSASNIRNMFPDMQDICSQMVLKWYRFGPSYVFDPSGDYTRLTFDTIALCSMSYRFNSFYQSGMPAFTQEMADFLATSSRRSFRPAIVKKMPLLFKAEDQKYFEAAKHMTDVAKGIIRLRKEQPVDRPDLLTLMLEGKDPKTEAQLSEENIVYNLLTFLIAGHETTSGMLTFATYYLLKNPSCLQKLREELDEVLGSEDPSLEDLGKLPYLTAVLREALRLWPTVPARSVIPKQDFILIGGDGDPMNPRNKRYAINKDQIIFVHALTAHRDPLVWGDDAEEFRPERMLDGRFEALPKHAWQPFSFGLRACIGRSFAWQEAMLVLASVFSKFDVVVPRRQRMESGRRGPVVGVPRPMVAKKETVQGPERVLDAHPLLVLYGSNTGTAQAFAQRIAHNSYFHGFKSQLGTLDSAAGRLPTNVPVVIVTASFEGEPADNAAQFVTWLSSICGERRKNALDGVAYAIFGCGNQEWVGTYQRIPKFIDEKMSDVGAKRFMERGEGDASSPYFFQKFDEFEEQMWEVLEKARSYIVARNITPPSGRVELTISLKKFDATRKELLRVLDIESGRVIGHRLLTKPGVPEKRHVEIELPEDMTYRAGDYLAIIPSNPVEIVGKAIRLFELSGQQEIYIKANGPTTLPTGSPITVHTLLSDFVELSQPVTTRDLRSLIEVSSSKVTIEALSSLLNDYHKVITKRISILDLLEVYTDINLPFATFLSLLPPMRVRQYSISSSPLVHPSSVSLTFSVIDSPSTPGSKRFQGVASTFLARLKKGDIVSVAVRPSAAQFSLPVDPTIPIIMFAAGSGLAPFRGFVQDRAAQKAAGRIVGRTVLFFGCRDPEEDYLYMDSELQEWQQSGVVEVRPSFSKRSEVSEGCKYVQHRVWHDRQLLSELIEAQARLYTCGSRRMAHAVKQVCIDILKDSHPDWSDERTLDAWERVQKERYATDVFD
uniref:Inducible nitric oxide synthase-like protein n=1 Tax=Inonotus obliquus TaxID=167356 RepID=A0A0C5LBP0_9AGAM|nr:inducible nitric oxide synthase-like protein [Inonotus obliquus]